MKFVKYILYLLLTAIPQLLLSQELHYDQYTTDDGLPSNTIYEIVQDSSGLLWMGTENGLVSFDGVSFERFSDSRLKDNDIIELELSKDGHVTFCNLSNQYCRLEDSDVVILEYDFDQNGLVSGGLFDLFSNDEADFLVYTIDRSTDSLRLFVYDNHLLYTGIKGVMSISKNEQNGNVVLTGKGKLKVEKDIDGYKLEEVSESIIYDTHINPILTTSDERIYLCEEGIEIIDSAILNLVMKQLVRDICYFQKYAFLALQDGLVIYNRKEKEELIILKDRSINKLFIDDEQNLWISSANDGLYKLRLDFWNYTYSELLGNIRDMLVSKNRKILISDNLFLEVDNGNSVVSIVPTIQSGNAIICRSEDRDIVVDRKHIYNRIKNRKTWIISKINHEKSGFMPKYAFLGGGNIILADRQSVFVIPEDFNKGQLKIMDYRLFDLRKIQCMVYDSLNSQLMIGTALGLYTYADDRKLEKSELLVNQNVTSICVDKNQRYWYGTANNGVYIVNSYGDLDSINMSNGLSSNVINDIKTEGKWTYLATSKGVARVDLSTTKIDLITEFEGLANNDVRSIVIGNNGELFATQKDGFVELHSRHFEKEMKRYDIKLEQILCNNVVADVSKNDEYVFEYSENTLDIKFDYITLNKLESKDIRYKINNSPSFTSNNTGLEIRLLSLTPGIYEFEVQGVLTNNRFTDSKFFKISILPPWWQTNWARIFGVLLLLSIVYVYVSIRSRRIQKEEEIKRVNLQQLEKSKRDYIQQINAVRDQALQLQMNPHFIFNAMNAIQSFITSNKEEDATLYLAKFAKLIRLIFEYSNTNLITLEAELNFVNLYLDLENLRFSRRVTSSLTVDDELNREKDILKIPPLIIQPVIENSFKHGLFHKMKDGKVTVNYKMIDDTIVITVEDNGIGREASYEMKKETNENERPSGLGNVKQRLDLLSYDDSTLENSMNVEDLYTNGVAIGTRTTIYLSLKENKLK